MNIHDQNDKDLQEYQEDRKEFSKERAKVNKMRRNLYQSFRGIYKKQGYKWNVEAQDKYRKISEEKYPRVIHSDN